jgi:L-iditol 2-dehydrogenase
LKVMEVFIFMRAAVLVGIEKIEMREVADIRLAGKRDVLVRVERVGVCGSDVHYYETGRIGSQVVKFPFIVGHECSGTVAEIGSDVSRVKVGDKVTVDPAQSCGKCDQCRAGRENTCRNLRFLGTPGQGNGCLCEYIVMGEDSLYPLGDKVTLDQGALCEPLSIGVYAARRGAVKGSDDVAILGAGPIGLSVILGCHGRGAKSVYMTDVLDYRVEVARKAGAMWAGNADKSDIVEEILEQQPRASAATGDVAIGMDVVFECAGKLETLDQAVELLKPGGRLILVGIPREDRVSFAIDKIRRKELTIINIRRQNGCVQEALDLVASGEADVDFMVTHRFKLEDAQEAFELVRRYGDGVIKAMITVNS